MPPELRPVGLVLDFFNPNCSLGILADFWQTDKASNGANFMCVRIQQCTYVTHAYTYVHGVRTLVRRPMPLPPVGEVTIPTSYNGPLTLYFYNVPYQGWLTRNDYLYGPPKP